MAEQRKRSLVKAFAKAAAKTVVGVILGASLLYFGWIGAVYAGRGEPLTKSEAQLVQGVFGDEINPSLLRKHFRAETTPKSPFATKASVGMVMPPFSHIDFYGPAATSNDYASDNEFRFGVFMHEVTHCWQGQNLAFPLKEFEVYKYTLLPNSRWRDFGAEQQADIVENYSKRWLYPANVHIKHTAEDSLLAKVVETRFPQAKKTRLQLEEGGPRHA